jgi:high-affinity nickel-transport protein
VPLPKDVHVTSTTITAGRWTRAERMRITGIVGVIAALHVIGWTVYLFYASGPAGAGAFAGAGILAYTLGMRHAFDADHIAAIDDTTRLMLQRGRRPVGIGFFFAMGHSTVVLVLALIVALAAGAAGAAGTEFDGFRHVGGLVSQFVAMSFLLLVAALNAVVLVGGRRLALPRTGPEVRRPPRRDHSVGKVTVLGSARWPVRGGTSWRRS